MKLKALTAFIVFTLLAYEQAACAAISVDEDRANIIRGDSVVEKSNGYMEETVLVKGASATLTFGKGAQITTEGAYSSGARISGLSSTIIFGEKAVILTRGSQSNGAYVDGNGSLIVFQDGASITTLGREARGVVVRGVNSQISLTNDVTITTHGESGYGVFAAAAGSRILLESGTIIITSKTRAHGAVTSGNDARIRFGSGTIIATDSEEAYGAYSGGRDSRITFGSRTTITTDGASAHGAASGSANSEGGSLISFGVNAQIKTTGNDAHGAYAYGKDAKITFEEGAVITTTGRGAYGVTARGLGSSVSFKDNATIITSRDRAYGVYTVTGRTKISFDGSSVIATAGENAHAVLAKGGKSLVVFSGDSHIRATGDGVYGIRAEGSESSVTFKGDSTIITVEGNKAQGAVAYGESSMLNFDKVASLNIKGTDSHGVVAGGMRAKINFNDAAAITTDRANSHAAVADGVNSSIEFAADAALTTEGGGAHGAYTDNGSAGIKFNGDAIIQTSKKDSYALFAKQGSITSAQSSKYTVSGDMVADTGNISLKMADGSRFTGKTDARSGGISLAARGSDWNVTGTSNLTSLTLDSAVVDYRKADLGTTITVGNLKGSGGTFQMKTDIEKEVSDKLVVTGTMNGSQHKIRVFNQGSAATTGNEIVKLVDTADKTGKFGLTNDVELGGWLYKLRQVDGGRGSQWELYSERTLYTDPGTGTDTDTGTDGTGTGGNGTGNNNQGGTQDNGTSGTPDNGDNGTVKGAGTSNNDNGTDTGIATGTSTGTDTGQIAIPMTIAAGNVGQLSSTADAAINTFYANYLMSYTETQTLIQRLGDLRETPWNSGFWFRAHGGKIEASKRVLLDSFDMDYGGVQIGYDRKFAAGSNGDLYAGIMFGYSKGDLDLANGGSGDVNSKMLGVYGTYVRSNGFFADVVLKYQWMDNDFNVLDSASNSVTADKINTDAFGASLEIGQRIHFGKDKKSGWYVEPQAQISYTRQDGGLFNASNGLQVGVEPFTSVLGRLGLLAGYETERSNFYAKVSKVKEFDGDITIKMNSNPTQDSFGDNWWVYGIGFTSQVNDRNSTYFDLERTHGGDFQQTWALKAGWRIVF